MVPPEPTGKPVALLIADLTAARDRVALLDGELQVDEWSLLRFHTVCRRCTQPLQMVFGFCDGMSDELTDAVALAHDFQTVFLSPLMASLQNCGVAVKSAAEGVKLSLPAAKDAPQSLSDDPPHGEELLRKQHPKLLQEQVDDLLEREQALRQRLDQLRRAYEPYRQICLACREPLEALLHIGLWRLSQLSDSKEALQCLRRSAKTLETVLNTMGITLARYEDVAGNPEERGRFGIVEHGYVYPAVYWRGDFFFEAVGQTTVDRAAGAGS